MRSAYSKGFRRMIRDQEKWWRRARDRSSFISATIGLRAGHEVFRAGRRFFPVGRAGRRMAREERDRFARSAWNEILIGCLDDVRFFAALDGFDGGIGQA